MMGQPSISCPENAQVEKRTVNLIKVLILPTLFPLNIDQKDVKYECSLLGHDSKTICKFSAEIPFNKKATHGTNSSQFFSQENDVNLSTYPRKITYLLMFGNTPPPPPPPPHPHTHLEQQLAQHSQQYYHSQFPVTSIFLKGLVR